MVTKRQKHFWRVFNNKIVTTALVAFLTAFLCIVSAKIQSKPLLLTTRN